MRPLLHPFALGCLAALAFGQTPPPPTDAPVLSERTQQAVRDRLPRYNPAASDAARKARAAAAEAKKQQAEATKTVNADGEEVVVLPEFKVRERKMEQPKEDDWLKNKEVTAKAMRLKEAEMNALDLALNRWHIPLLTPSFADRARAEYEAAKQKEETDRLDRLEKLSPRPDGK